MKKRYSILVCCMLALSALVHAQVTKVCFNEILVNNKTNYVDEYGQRSSWIELFNASYSVVDIGGCYLSNDLNNPTMYMIPKGDVLTKMAQRQHVLFFVDGQAHKGNFYLNFTLDTAGINTLYFFNADGKSLIDSVIVPVMEADVSYARPVDGEDAWDIMYRITPSTNNLILDKNEKVEKFANNDPAGIGMTISAISVVFSVLLFLSLFFLFLSRFLKRMTSKPAKTNLVRPAAKIDEIPGEVIAAISAAIVELENDVHDIEHTIITIERTRRTYSPWSSKIYGLRTPVQK